MSFWKMTALIVCLVVQSGALSAQVADERLQEFVRTDLLNNVVKITGGDNEYQGYGLIIGRQFDRIYIATALHILPVAFQYGDRGAPPLLIRLHGFSEAWEAVPGRVTGSEDHDLAVIEAYVPRATRGDGVTPLVVDHWRQQVFDAYPQSGDRAELMASPHNIGYTGGNARIRTVENGRVVSFEGLTENPGQSGAPISTDRGIVGIYLGTKTPQIVSLPEIAEIVAREFGPGAFQLAPVEPRPSPAILCIGVRDAGLDEITVIGPSGGLSFDERGCSETVSGSHRVGSFFVGCEPDAFVVQPNQQLHLELACKPIPDGAWTTRGQGFLSVHRCGPTCWTFAGSLPQNRGELSGRFEGILPRLRLVEGRMRGRVPIGGSAILERDRLYLDLFAEGKFFEEEFYRP